MTLEPDHSAMVPTSTMVARMTSWPMLAESGTGKRRLNSLSHWIQAIPSINLSDQAAPTRSSSPFTTRMTRSRLATHNAGPEKSAWTTPDSRTAVS